MTMRPIVCSDRIEGLLHIRLLRSPHPHAKIVAIDKTAALNVPGVHAVLTHDDAPDRLFRSDRGPPAHQAPAFTASACEDRRDRQDGRLERSRRPRGADA